MCVAMYFFKSQGGQLGCKGANPPPPPPAVFCMYNSQELSSLGEAHGIKSISEISITSQHITHLGHLHIMYTVMKNEDPLK